MPATKPPSLPVIDLFAGVGGLSLGACRAGFKLKMAVEKDRYAFAAHSANFANSIHSSDDINELNGTSLLQKAGLDKNQLAGLIGGPPCQGFSTMGHRQIDDSRNDLFKKFFTLVKETRPKFFLAENVPGIMNTDYDAIRAQAMDGLEGYTLLQPLKVCAADYGAATSRTRVLFIGYLSDEIGKLTVEDFTPAKDIKRINVRTALTGLPITIKDTWDNDDNGWRKVRTDIDGEFGSRVRAHVPHGVGHSTTLNMWNLKKITSGCIATHHETETIKRFANIEPGKTDKISRGLRLDPNGLCPTLRAGTDSERGSYQAVRPIHPTEPRVITPREAARLQGFPDWFRFDKTKWHSFRQIGNSVSPILAESILGVFYKKMNAGTS